MTQTAAPVPEKAGTSVMSSVSLALSLLQVFMGSNPTVEIVEEVVPAIVNAVTSEKQGVAFALPAVPLTLGGVKGSLTLAWTPAGPIVAGETAFNPNISGGHALGVPIGPGTTVLAPETMAPLTAT